MFEAYDGYFSTYFFLRKLVPREHIPQVARRHMPRTSVGSSSTPLSLEEMLSRRMVPQPKTPIGGVRNSLARHSSHEGVVPPIQCVYRNLGFLYFEVPLYRGTSLTKKRTPLRLYRRPTPRVLGGP